MGSVRPGPIRWSDAPPFGGAAAFEKDGNLPGGRGVGAGGPMYNMLPMRVHGMPYAYYLRVYSS